MKKYQVLGIICFSLLLVGCGAKENKDEVKNKSTSESTLSSSKEKNSEDLMESVTSDTTSTSSVDKEDMTPQTETTSSGELEINITDARSATDYLLKQLNLGPDIQGSGEENSVTELETDEKGDFYTIRLISLELKNNGGSGTVDRYRVYLDGNYEPLNN